MFLSLVALSLAADPPPPAAASPLVFDVVEVRAPPPKPEVEVYIPLVDVSSVVKADIERTIDDTLVHTHEPLPLPE